MNAGIFMVKPSSLQFIWFIFDIYIYIYIYVAYSVLLLAMGWMTGWMEFRVKNFFLFMSSGLGLGSTQPPIEWVPAALSLGRGLFETAGV
jgi:hypothetical protein